MQNRKFDLSIPFRKYYAAISASITVSIMTYARESIVKLIIVDVRWIRVPDVTAQAHVQTGFNCEKGDI